LTQTRKQRSTAYIRSGSLTAARDSFPLVTKRMTEVNMPFRSATER
jgi:hypothetical protein